MNAYIEKIALFNKEGEIREVPLTDGLNIITGDSKTGKSALIEIVDYCLFSSRSTIPVGKITNFTELFSIIINLNGTYLIIARPKWKSPNRLKAYFSVETDKNIIDNFSYSYFDNKELRGYKEVQPDVESYLGLSVLDTRPDRTEDKRAYGKATLRSFISLLFQHQTLIANKHSLFYRFEDSEKRKKTIEQLPILLGWVDSEYYSTWQELEKKRQQLKVEYRREKKLRVSDDELIKKLRKPIAQYYSSIGYDLPEDIKLATLKQFAQELPPIPPSVYEDSDINFEHSELKDRRAGYQSELKKVNKLIKQISENSKDADNYNEKLESLIHFNKFEKVSEQITCPLCHSQSTGVDEAVQAVINSREKLYTELKTTSSYSSDSTEHLAQLFEQRDFYKKNIKEISAQIRNLEKTLNEIDLNDDIRDGLLLLKGRIEIILEQILEEMTLSDTPLNIDELKSDIEILEAKLAGYNLNVKYEEANSFINRKMTSISERLDFEEELQPGKMIFDLKTFDFHYSFEGSNILLSEMGSGANWLACHLSLFLSILHLVSKEEKSSIPSILFIDQPSQVYFPKVSKSLNEELKTYSESEKEDADKDIEQVKKFFNVMIEEIGEIKNQNGYSPQIVVMEHADEDEFSSYVRKRWTTETGEKLI